MSARIPHLLTRLLSSDDLDALESAMVMQAGAAVGTPASATWMAAAALLEKHRAASFERRSKLTPSARRKSLGLRYTR